MVNDHEDQRVAIRAMPASLDVDVDVDVDVVEADSGRAALCAVLRQTFALILMDVRMPTRDPSAAAGVKRHPDREHGEDHRRGAVRAGRNSDSQASTAWPAARPRPGRARITRAAAGWPYILV